MLLLKEIMLRILLIQLLIFVESGQGWCPIRVRTAGYDANDTISVTVENNQFIDSYYLDGTTNVFIENPSYDSVAEGFKKIYVVGKNYYEVNGEVLTTLTDANFTNAAISIDEAYAKKEDVPTF